MYILFGIVIYFYDKEVQNKYVFNFILNGIICIYYYSMKSFEFKLVYYYIYDILYIYIGISFYDKEIICI